MNTSNTSLAKPGVDQSEALLGLLEQVTSKPSSTIKGSLRWYYRALPSLLAESFLGPLVSTTAYT
ncbi:MAG TPA: hypothetical protein ENL07_03390, partial [Chlorobaculum parvum]|nr:hypothetical protein [Chlorobaculum parvum]